LLRSVRYGFSGAVLAGMIGGVVAWNHVDKTVTLVVDGQVEHVQTTASTVSDVLQAAGFRAGIHDIVAPSVTAPVHNGSTIVFRRGRLLHLEVDGDTRFVWTTAPTVADALAQLGYSTADFTSVSRSRRLPLTPTDIDVRTPALVTLRLDGVTQMVTTTALTVGDMLNEMNVAIGKGDKVSVPLSAPVIDGAKISVSRTVRETLIKTMTVRYSTKVKHDSSLDSGVTKVIKPGKNGLAEVTYAVVYVNGQLAGQTRIKMVVLQSPTTRVVRVGTKRKTVRSANFVAPDPGSAKALARQMLATRGWGDDQYDCLVSLWGHESGWRVDASNPSGAYGIPQALPGSKMAVDGADWRTSAQTQITWGLDYISERYGTPCGAWSAWNAHGGWY
jgi:resuscitation-promoting factor RpfB